MFGGLVFVFVLLLHRRYRRHVNPECISWIINTNKSWPILYKAQDDVGILKTNVNELYDFYFMHICENKILIHLWHYLFYI